MEALGRVVMSDPIRDALIELVEAVNEQFFGNANNAIALSPRVITANNKAIRQLLRQPETAAPPATMDGGGLISDALKELVEAMFEQFFGANDSKLSPRVIKATNEAHLLLIQRQSEVTPAAQPPAAAPPPAPVAWCNSGDFMAAAEKRQSFSGWRERHYDCDMALYAAPPPARMAWPELPLAPEEWRTRDRADTVFARGIRLGYGYARQKLAAMNPNHRPENHQ
jgi:hypothetical protein